MQIIEDENTKILKSLHYNYIFNKKNGFFARWGATKDEDPDFSPFGPEIADIEISSANASDIKNKTNDMLITEGGCSGGCRFCYKGSTSNQTVHMSLDTYKKVLDKLGNVITQVALGLCSADSHPQLFEILWETRNRSIIPNITINPSDSISDDYYKKISEVCGAVAVSVNKHNKDRAYNAIKKLSQDNNMSQINIHIVLAEDTIPFIMDVVNDMKNDERLSAMNALVMLSFKDKANTNCYKPITQSSYNGLVEFCEEMGIRFGFDSCGAPLYKKFISGKSNEKELSKCIEFCESTGFSVYCDVVGSVHPCSFSCGTHAWNHNMKILDYPSILDVWYSDEFKTFRKNLLKNNRNCPIYQISTP